MTLSTSHVTDVCIVGYGPVGAVLAALLARHGVSTVVVDGETDIYPLPRAAHVDAEAMRILQAVGCADDMAAVMRVNAGMDFLTADHRVLMEMRSGGFLVGGWPPSQFIHQPTFERQLRAAVASLGVDVRLGHAVTAISHDDTGVRATLTDGSVVQSRYLVGCDGARSTVRRVIGTAMDDLAFEEPWLVVDLILNEAVTTLPGHALQVCDPTRPHTVVPMPEPRFRLEFMLLPGESPDDLQHADTVAELLEPWVPAGSAVIERSAVYTFHGLIAHDWRDGRVFLAGDAAHQMPPFLGQGMCSGLRDAANLAWKLSAVLNGAPDELLETYQREREPHVRSIVEAAVGAGRIICTTDPEQAAGRDAMMLAAREVDPSPSPGSVPTSPLSGPLVAEGGGSPAPQPIVGGTRLDDLVGPRWVLVARTGEIANVAAKTWRAVDPVVFAVDRDPEVAVVLGDAAVAVVRPDRCLYARSADAGLAPPALMGPG